MMLLEKLAMFDRLWYWLPWTCRKWYKGMRWSVQSSTRCKSVWDIFLCIVPYVAVVMKAVYRNTYRCTCKDQCIDNMLEIKARIVGSLHGIFWRFTSLKSMFTCICFYLMQYTNNMWHGQIIWLTKRKKRCKDNNDYKPNSKRFILI